MFVNVEGPREMKTGPPCNSMFGRFLWMQRPIQMSQSYAGARNQFQVREALVDI